MNLQTSLHYCKIIVAISKFYRNGFGSLFEYRINDQDWIGKKDSKQNFNEWTRLPIVCKVSIWIVNFFSLECFNITFFIFLISVFGMSVKQYEQRQAGFWCRFTRAVGRLVKCFSLNLNPCSKTVTVNKMITGVTPDTI